MEHQQDLLKLNQLHFENFLIKTVSNFSFERFDFFSKNIFCSHHSFSESNKKFKN